MGIIKYLYLIMSVAQYGVCTAKTECAKASSCCTAFAAAATAGTAVGSVLVCWNPGSAVGAGGVIPPSGTAGVESGTNKGYLMTACPAATTGASTLAVSAAAVATA